MRVSWAYLEMWKYLLTAIILQSFILEFFNSTILSLRTTKISHGEQFITWTKKSYTTNFFDKYEKSCKKLICKEQKVIDFCSQLNQDYFLNNF